MTITNNPYGIKIFNKGFTFVELLLVIFVTGIIAVPVTSSISNISARTKGIDNYIQATYLVREGLDLTRSFRDADWAKWCSFGCSQFQMSYAFGQFGTMPAPSSWAQPEGYYIVSWNDYVKMTRLSALDGGGKTDPLTRLYLDNNNMYSHNNSGTPSIFSRVIGVTNIVGAGYTVPYVELKVIATVSWSEDGVPKNVVGETHLFNFYKP